MSTEASAQDTRGADTADLLLPLAPHAAPPAPALPPGAMWLGAGDHDLRVNRSHGRQRPCPSWSHVSQCLTCLAGGARGRGQSGVHGREAGHRGGRDCGAGPREPSPAAVSRVGNDQLCLCRGTGRGEAWRWHGLEGRKDGVTTGLRGPVGGQEVTWHRTADVGCRRPSYPGTGRNILQRTGRLPRPGIMQLERRLVSEIPL